MPTWSTVEELLAAKPTEESVTTLANTLAVVSSIGSVCELPAVTRFFNGNPNLGLVSGGIEQFTGKAGLKRWSTVGDIVARGWDGVLAAIDEVISTPEVDERASKLAADELAEPYEEEEVVEDDVTDSAEDDEDSEESAPVVAAAPHAAVVLGSDEEFWTQVGIDPVRILTTGGTLYTLRCYFDDRPIFLGRNGRISVFPSERTLARYLADEHDHDLSDLSTYDDIRTAATDGSLRVEVTDENIYVLTGLSDDISRRAGRHRPRSARTGRGTGPRRRGLLGGGHRRPAAGRRPLAGQAGQLRAGARRAPAPQRPLFRGGQGVGRTRALRGVAAAPRVTPAMSDTPGRRLARALQESTELAERTVAGLGPIEADRALFFVQSAYDLAIEMCFQKGDPGAPRLTNWELPWRKFGGDNPTTTYLSAPVSASFRYRLRGHDPRRGVCGRTGLHPRAGLQRPVGEHLRRTAGRRQRRASTF